MTTENQVDKVTATGDGSARTFSFSPIKIFADTELAVVTTVTATGVETIRTLGTGTTNFSQSIAAADFPSTGSITFPATLGTALPSTETITTKRIPKLEQQTNLESQGGYDPQVQEDQFDKIVHMIIHLQEELDRCIKLTVSDTFSGAADLERTASQFLRWNAAADGVDAVAVATTTGSASDVAPQDVSVSAAAAGSNAPYSRDDHVHLLPTTVPRLATENIYTESQIWFKGADVASTTTMTLGAGNEFDITGTTAITSIVSIGIGTLILLHFDGVLTFTHHATNLVCPGGEDIITYAGMELLLYEYATTDWRVVDPTNMALYRHQTDDLTAKVTWFADFLNGVVDADFSSTRGSDNTGEVATIVSNTAGGEITIKSATADTGTHSAVCTTLTLDTLNWRADQGGLVMEARLKIDDISEAVIFVGFTDVISTTVELPIFKTLGADTIDSDAADACGIGYDIDGTTDEWYHAGVDTDTDTAATHSGSAPVDDTYVILRVEVSSAGAVRGYVDGVAIGAATASSVTPTVALTPIIVIGNRSANQVIATIDYFWVQANR